MAPDDLVIVLKGFRRDVLLADFSNTERTTVAELMSRPVSGNTIYVVCMDDTEDKKAEEPLTYFLRAHSGVSSTENYFINNVFSCTEQFRDAIRSIASVVHKYGKLLTLDEKDIIRQINFKPTLDGIKSCLEWHGNFLRWISNLPRLSVRFDRRIPCWRSTRWKSLT